MNGNEARRAFARSQEWIIKKQLTRKLIQATSDKVELNKQALKWKKSMEEAAKALGGGKKKLS